MSGSRLPEPPKLAVAVLSRVLPESDGDGILGDLREVHASRPADHGRFRSQVWFWAQTLPLVWAFARERLADDVDGPVASAARPAPRVGWREGTMRSAANLKFALEASFTRARDVGDGAGGFVRYPVATMTSSGFVVTGVTPQLGRTLTAADGEPGARPVVVIGSRVWRGLFGSDPGVVGRPVAEQVRSAAEHLPGVVSVVLADRLVPVARALRGHPVRALRHD